MMRFSKICFLALALTGNLLVAPASAAPEEEIKDEIEFLTKISEVFQAFCQGTDCSDPETVRRHLADEGSPATRSLEASFGAFLEKHRSPSSGRKLSHLFDNIGLCLVQTLACDLYLDNLYMPQVENYRYNDVALTNECESETGLDAIRFTSKTGGDTAPDEFRYHNTGPEQLQGVFSLNYEPCSWSSLVSFAKSADTAPGGISTGVLGDAGGSVVDFLFGSGTPGVFGPVRAPSDYVYAMRVLGDANWAFGGGQGLLGAIAPIAVTALDLVYKFVLLEGTTSDPIKFQIIPDIKIPFTCIRLEIKNCLESLVRFEMTLVEEQSDISGLNCNGEADALSAFQGGAVVWRRDSWFLQDCANPQDPLCGGSQELPDSCYFIVQVVDGAGQKVQPAWDDFVDQQQACQGTTCPINTFSSLQGSAESGFCQCAYTGELPYGLDNIAGPFSGAVNSGKGYYSGKGMKRGRQRGRRHLRNEEDQDMENTLSSPAISNTNKNKSRRSPRGSGIAQHAQARALAGGICGKYTRAPSVTPEDCSGFPCGVDSKSGDQKYAYCYFHKTDKDGLHRHNACEVVPSDFAVGDSHKGDPAKPVLECGCCSAATAPSGAPIKDSCSLPP